ncbi:MAG: hypothetical protein MJ252_05060 [archaeon]|nr:hypothetical protein [archaeon]
MSSELLCKKCKNEYNDSDKCPLVLSCCCDYCKECVRNMFISRFTLKCPKHGLIKGKSMEEIPKSEQLLEIIKSRRRELKFPFDSNEVKINCLRHKQNKIKYKCEKCNQFLCKECFVEHSNHECQEAYITQEIFLKEIKQLETLIENKKEEFEKYQGNIDKSSDEINLHYKSQRTMIENFFKNIIQSAQKVKERILSQLIHFEETYKKQFDILKDKNLCFNSDIIKMLNKLGEIKNILYKNGEYESFYKIKKRIEYQLENQGCFPEVKLPSPNDLPKYSVSNCVANFQNEKFYGGFKNVSNEKLNFLENSSSDFRQPKALTENGPKHPIIESTMTSFFNRNKDEEKNIFKHNLFEDNSQPTKIKENSQGERELIGIGVGFNNKDYNIKDFNYRPEYNNSNPIYQSNRPNSKNSLSAKRSNENKNNIFSQIPNASNVSNKLHGNNHQNIMSLESNSPKRFNTSSNKDQNKPTKKIHKSNNSIVESVRPQSNQRQKPQTSRDSKKTNNLGSYQRKLSERNLSNGKPKSPKNKFIAMPRPQPILADPYLINESNGLYAEGEPKENLHQNEFAYVNQMGNRNIEPGIYKPKGILNEYSPGSGKFDSMTTNKKEKEKDIGEIQRESGHSIGSGRDSYNSEDNSRIKIGNKAMKKNIVPKEIFKKKVPVRKSSGNNEEEEYS